MTTQSDPNVKSIYCIIFGYLVSRAADPELDLDPTIEKKKRIRIRHIYRNAGYIQFSSNKRILRREI